VSVIALSVLTKIVGGKVMAKQSYERKELASMREANRKRRDKERAEQRAVKNNTAVTYKRFSK
jgi:hypothetical protein